MKKESYIMETIAKSREEIEALKANWKVDACWDIEDTEGFEPYHYELLEFRLRCEAEWLLQKAKAEKKRQSEVCELAKTLNTSTQVAEYLLSLQNRIQQLEQSCKP